MDGSGSVPDTAKHGVPEADQRAERRARPPVRVLMTQPCATVGVGMTCRSRVSAAGAAGYRTDLMTSRYDRDGFTAPRVWSALPGPMRHFPFPALRDWSERRLHDHYLSDLEAGDIAHLWPSVPVEVFRTLKSRGIRIVAEAVNTRMAVARPLLDAVYDEAGIAPAHRITDDRIADQAERYGLADAIFAPSPATEAALVGTPLAQRCISTSYGTWLNRSEHALRPRRPQDAPVTFLFVGSVCVRKGIPRLLRAWREMPERAKLRLVGEVEPGLAERFRDDLSRPNVSLIRFTPDVGLEYAAADVFVLPSVEEGDPIVTYEAAAHGLPVIASASGAGRMGSETGAIRIVDPADRDAFAAALQDMASDADLRAGAGARALAAVRNYDWSLVGPRSYDALHRFFASASNG